MKAISLTLFAIFAALSFSSNAFAGFYRFLVFDYKHCQSYIADSEYDTGDINYPAWKKKVEELNANSSNADWWIYQTATEVFGLCRYKYTLLPRSIEFACHVDSDRRFQLRGATYKAVFDKDGNVLQLNCVKGCNTETPKVLFDAQFEFDDSEENVKKDPNYIILQNAEKQFRRACPRGK